MRHLGALAFACVVAASPACAASLTDLGAWTKGFEDAALANDPDAMLGRLVEVAVPGFNLTGLRDVIHKVQGFVGTRPGDFTEAFDERNVGSFLKRINIAVRYPKTYMYYTVTFIRDAQGWRMTQFDYNTNINDVFALKWPG